ncbi:MAG: hypothetical protein ACE5OO_05065 [Candidatus Bathyarchaeia archaeon]
MKDWRGVIIAEGLSDPTVINGFSVYRASITEDGMAVDYEGNIGRWHIYYVRCSREEIDALQPHILRGWYAHFWNRDRIIVVYHDRQFELARYDRSTWEEAVEHGRAQGIHERELDFPTE